MSENGTIYNVETICRGCPSLNEKREHSCSNHCTYRSLNVYDWLSGLPEAPVDCDIVEIRFKNTRKGFYYNVNKLHLQTGDIVAVEASPGHDIGEVSLKGELVYRQMIKYGINPKEQEFKKIYRKAKTADIEKWKEATSLERPTMLEARKIAESLELNMKIGDVEYQGDKTKAIFYYIAEERVDFRELIKVLADKFKVRIEMRQIGARQEAGRIGGIGSCGRELCCSSWLTNFISVTSNAARLQEISLNPQKLAGQCSKLKCCINYEVSGYRDAKKDFPDDSQVLQTEEGDAHFIKADVYKKIIWYSYEPDSTLNLIPVSLERVDEIIEMNQAGKKPKRLEGEKEKSRLGVKSDNELPAEESITRFDERKTGQSKRKKKKNKNKK